MGGPAVTPVILSGGSGSRLWPLSRTLFPKQLLPLVSDRTMIQETALRVRDRSFGQPLVICNEAHRFMVSEQLREVGVMPLRVVLEPVGRNTAPACVAAALLLIESNPDAILAILPSDHVIRDTEAFGASMQLAAAAAEEGRLVTFGMQPTSPETGYGYIQQGEAFSEGCFVVERFIEKPDAERAASMLAQGGYHWNSGMFVFKASVLLDEVKRLCPEIHDGVAQAVSQAKSETDFLRLDVEAFSATPSASIDYAVMEHTDRAAVVPANLGWSDVGSWSGLWDIKEKDAKGTVTEGDVIAIDCQGSYLRGNGTLVAGVGLTDTIVVATDDAVLVADKSRVQDVRKVVEKLKEMNRTEGDLRRKVYRPWGYYQTIDVGNRFQVKQLMIRPGGQLSLQMHHHRAEHWVVVEGTALITCDGKNFLLHENESTYIPLGARHRLENPGKVPLRLIEVQSGTYLGEDDIVRFEDNYGRV